MISTKLYLLLALIFLISSCTTKTVQQNGGTIINVAIQGDKIISEPDIESINNTLNERVKKYYSSSCNVSFNNDNEMFIVELPEVYDTTKCKFLLTSKGKLEMTETYDNAEYSESLLGANAMVLLLGLCKEKFTNIDSTMAFTPLFTIFQPSFSESNNKFTEGPVIGFCKSKDTSCINTIFTDKKILSTYPKDVNFAWGLPFYGNIPLFMLKSNSSVISNNSIKNTSVKKGVMRNYEIEILLNNESSKDLKKFTQKNIQKAIAVKIDETVYSAPLVNSPLNNKFNIAGAFDEKMATAIEALISSNPIMTNLKIVSYETKNWP